MEDRCKTEIYQLVERKLVCAAMADEGVDCSTEIAEIDAAIERAKARDKIAEIAEYYKHRKRWKGNPTEAQKKKIKELQSLQPYTIAKALIK